VKKHIVLFALLLMSISIQAQWQWQNPLPQSNMLCDVHFINESVGYAVGEYGSIIKTTDGGENWILLNCQISGTFQAVKFIDELTGFVVGYNYHPDVGYSYSGYIIKTSDGGETWDILYKSSEVLYNIFIVGEELIWVIGGEGTILHSKDCGDTWQNQECNTVGALQGIWFINDSCGWITGSSRIYYTNNGGDNWQLIYSNNLVIYLSDICFLDENNGWTVGQGGRIMHTIDGGYTWDSQAFGNGSGLLGVIFTDLLNGWAVGYNNVIMHTVDGGNTWEVLSEGNSDYITNVWSTSNDNCWIVGKGGRILAWNGFSLNQQQVYVTKKSIKGVDFYDSENGWIVGDSGTIFYTYDKGQNWVLQNSYTANNLNNISIVTSDIGLIAGDNGLILRTDNGGNTWNIQSTGITNNLLDNCFINYNYGWSVGEEGTILYTSDGGNNWVAQYSDSTWHFNSVHFIDYNNGWVVGKKPHYPYEGIILHTSNGGDTWEEQPGSLYFTYQGVCFTDLLNGWAVGISHFEEGDVQRTTDGGITWEFQPITIPFVGANCIYFVDNLNGWIAGESNIIFNTTDGGETWEEKDIGTRERFNDICFTDINNGWLVGGSIGYSYSTGSIILHTESDIITTDYTTPKNSISPGYLLVYPNPLNGNKLFIETNNKALIDEVRIYDSNAKLLQFINNIKSNKYSISTSKLPSGLYIIYYKSQNKSSMEKFIIN